MFPLEIHIPLKIKEEKKISLNVKVQESIKLTIKESGGGAYPIYTGETEVEPKTVPQTLETKNTSVLSDINVLKIPYFETSNIKGTTVIIGGNG